MTDDREALEAMIERAEAEADAFGVPISADDVIPARWLNPPRPSDE